MIVVAKITAADGKAAEVEKALLGIIPHVSEEEGTVVYTLHRDQNNPHVFLFYEKYRDMDAFKVHSSTPHFKALFKTLNPLLASPPEIGMYTELAGITS